MTFKKWLYYFSKFTFLDEILGFIYWAAALYGLFLITRNTGSSIELIFFIAIYVVVIVILYIFALKKITKFFKRDPEKH